MAQPSDKPARESAHADASAELDETAASSALMMRAARLESKTRELRE